jgi:hypothetical protein
MKTMVLIVNLCVFYVVGIDLDGSRPYFIKAPQIDV